MIGSNFSYSQFINFMIAMIWLINGLFCKLLNIVPRHHQIVGEILDREHATLLTTLIGASEILMAIWILSKYKSMFATFFQIAIIAVMNIIELNLVPELLLFGKWNSVLALILIIIILCNEFLPMKKNEIQQSHAIIS